MASAAEQMAANLSWGALGKATELKQRIYFTIGLLIIYRLGTYIPVPGIDGTALRSFVADVSGGLGGMLAMFTGGALTRMGIFALGIMPYISTRVMGRCCWGRSKPMVWPWGWKRRVWRMIRGFSLLPV
jgi:preprotein translocase subunit SecY